MVLNTFSNLNCVYVFTAFFFLVSNMSYSSFHGIAYKYTKIVLYGVLSEIYHSLTVPLLIDSRVTSGVYCYKQ